jgi:hypothetical protein
MLDDWQTNPDNFRNIKLSNREKQTILGTLLGTSSIIHPKKSKNPHLLMRCNKNLNVNWLRCKAEELKKLSRPKSFIEDNTGYRWNSFSNYLFFEYKNLFYEKGIKQIKTEVLDSLNDLGLCTWFLDKGIYKENLCGFKACYLNKNSISNIIEYFFAIGFPIANKNSNELLFKTKEISENFIKLINHCIPLALKASSQKNIIYS